MSRDEARNRLAGTFTFHLDGDKVAVTDSDLIKTIRDLTAESNDRPAIPAQLMTDPVGYARPLTFAQAA